MDVALIGVPTSAGAFAPGQEQAPAALRAAGLIEALREAGATVADQGDRDVWRWRPDRANPRAQNLDVVVGIVRDTAERVRRALAEDHLPLVLGGDCTVGIGTVAGQLAAGRRIGLVYFDLHADLNVPDSVAEGALDWMGMAHMLDEPGAEPDLAHAVGRAPLLAADQLHLFGWGPEQATTFERDAIARRAIRTIPVGEVAADPEAAAASALAALEREFDGVLVHFDVDVIDFTDTPLSENTGRNVGLAFDAAMRALATLLRSPKLAGVTVTELNPDHAEDGSAAIRQLANVLAAGLAASLEARER